MNARWRWFLWRFVTSAVLITVALYLFALGWDLGYFLIGLWGIGAVCLLIGIVIWFYSHPDNYRDIERELYKGPLTPHEARREHERAKQNELNGIGLSGYWVSRRYFGRFKGPRD